MTYKIDESVWRIIEVYRNQKRDIPKPAAWAWRLLEETVELCLAAGMSVREIDLAVRDAKSSEHAKEPDRAYDLARIESDEAIAGEVADVLLLASLLALAGDIRDGNVVIAAEAKVARLATAAKAGTLYFTPDGRFYRRKPNEMHNPRVVGAARSKPWTEESER